MTGILNKKTEKTNSLSFIFVSKKEKLVAMGALLSVLVILGGCDFIFGKKKIEQENDLLAIPFKEAGCSLAKQSATSPAREKGLKKEEAESVEESSIKEEDEAVVLDEEEITDFEEEEEEVKLPVLEEIPQFDYHLGYRVGRVLSANPFIVEVYNDNLWEGPPSKIFRIQRSVEDRRKIETLKFNDLLQFQTPEDSAKKPKKKRARCRDFYGGEPVPCEMQESNKLISLRQAGENSTFFNLLQSEFLPNYNPLIIQYFPTSLYDEYLLIYEDGRVIYRKGKYFNDTSYLLTFELNHILKSFGDSKFNDFPDVPPQGAVPSLALVCSRFQEVSANLKVKGRVPAIFDKLDTIIENLKKREVRGVAFTARYKTEINDWVSQDIKLSEFNDKYAAMLALKKQNNLISQDDVLLRSVDDYQWSRLVPFTENHPDRSLIREGRILYFVNLRELCLPENLCVPRTYGQLRVEKIDYTANAELPLKEWNVWPPGFGAQLSNAVDNFVPFDEKDYTAHQKFYDSIKDAKFLSQGYLFEGVHLESRVKEISENLLYN